MRNVCILILYHLCIQLLFHNHFSLDGGLKYVKNFDLNGNVVMASTSRQRMDSKTFH